MCACDLLLQAGIINYLEEYSWIETLITINCVTDAMTNTNIMWFSSRSDCVLPDNDDILWLVSVTVEYKV